MKRCIFAFILLLAVTGSLTARTGTISLKDGTRWSGEVSSLSDFLDWRRDIAVSGGQTFLIKPERKGRTKLQDIKEIRRIPASEAPEEGVELEDGSIARLLLQYRIVFNSGRILTISDFVTLENFYLDISQESGRSKRIYLSSISSLVFGTQLAASRPPTAAPVIKKAVRTPPPAPKMVSPPIPQQTESVILPMSSEGAEELPGVSPAAPNRILVWALAGLCVALASVLVFVVLRRNLRSSRKIHKPTRKKSRRR